MTDPDPIDVLLDELLNLRRQVSDLRAQLDLERATTNDLRSQVATLQHHLSPR